MCSWLRWLHVTVVLLLLILCIAAVAQSTNRIVGSPLMATADPLVPRPNEQPCIVPLFSNFQFAHFGDTEQSFHFAPGSDCPGPWEEVVFTADFSESAGRQFDRTVDVYLGNANIYFGTTPEPLRSQTNTWHIERNVTDYSALFSSPQTGDVILQNCTTECGLTGVFTVSAALEFFSARRHSIAARRVPDQVLPLIQTNSGGGINLPAFLDFTGAPTVLSTTFNLPTNVEKAFLDVITEGQQIDEFWYSCLPNDTNFGLLSFAGCGNTAFREAEITIDGTPAGVAPVSPWIFTGGLADPFLWIPTPGAQTLDFTPYRVDLTPFAGVLSNGQPHTIALSVFDATPTGANPNWAVTASLLLFQDHGSEKITGEVTENTIASPNPVVVENLTTANGNTSGTVSVTVDHPFTVAGFVNTSHGRIETKVEQDLKFSNVQNVVGDNNPPAPDVFLEVNGIQQLTTVSSKTTTRDGFVVAETKQDLSYPLSMNITITVNPDGSVSVAQTSPTQQGFEKRFEQALFGFPIFSSKVSNTFETIDAITFLAQGGATHSGQSSSQHFQFFDTRGQHYDCKIGAANNALTSADEGCNDTIRFVPGIE
jgi:hypothetical protein